MTTGLLVVAIVISGAAITYFICKAVAYIMIVAIEREGQKWNNKSIKQ